jgi:hypothetical protein
MGKTSDMADGLLLQLTSGMPTMACQLVVQLSDRSFRTKNATYGSGSLVHVEDMLLHLLKEEFGALGAIPPNSKIIFYGYWSPCKNCMAQTIPPRLAEMDIVNRNQRVRFRFRKYYTKAEWESAGKSVREGSGGHYFWESSEEADAEYARLGNLYGKFPMKSRSTETQVITSVSPRVAFIRGLSSSRATTQWSEQYRGKIFNDDGLVT